MSSIQVLTSNKQVREWAEKEFPELHTTGGAGDTKIAWDPKKKDEIDAAEKLFNTLKDKGYTFFQLGKEDKRGRRIDKFPRGSKKGAVLADIGDTVAVPRMAGG